jgi:hypothetical protein
MPKGKPTEHGKLGNPSPMDLGAGNQGKPAPTTNGGERKPPSGGTGTAKPEQGQSKPSNKGKES